MKVIITAFKASDSSTLNIEITNQDEGSPASNAKYDRTVIRADGLEIRVDTFELMNALLVTSRKYSIENALKEFKYYD